MHKDNGGEQLFSVLTEFLLDSAVRSTFTCPCTPQQNGLCERFNYTLADMTSAIISESRLSVQYWPYCFLHVSNVCNRLPYTPPCPTTPRLTKS
eukprot:4571138-Pleurochrysis_carterae.AAC.1